MTAVTAATTPTKGLKGVVAARTAYLLLVGELPTQPQLRKFVAALKGAQRLDRFTLKVIKDAPENSRPRDVLRTATSAVAYADPDRGDNSREAEFRKAIRLLAKTPTIIATFHRWRCGERPLVLKKNLSLSANFLYLLTGAIPEGELARAFDVALILHADHELNASTGGAVGPRSPGCQTEGHGIRPPSVPDRGSPGQALETVVPGNEQTGTA